MAGTGLMQGAVEFVSGVESWSVLYFKTDTMLIDADGMEARSTRHDRQSAACS